MTSNAEIAKAMAENMTHAAVPLYGKKLRLPDRGAIIGIIKEFRRLLFPAYFGDAQLMALPPENYAADGTGSAGAAGGPGLCRGGADP